MYKFTKREKLCNKIEIKKIFAQGEGFIIYPFSIKYNIKTNSPFPKVQVLIVSSKRYQRLSVNRNKIKRLVRECFRINKEEIILFAKESNLDINISISFISKKIPNYLTVNDTLKKILLRIITNTKENIERGS